MRIGFFTDTYTPQINGVVQSIRLFKRALEARGHEVIVFAPHPSDAGDCGQTVRFVSVPFLFQPEMRMASPVSLQALQRIEAAELDVVHSHDPFAIGLFGLTVARRKKIPYVHTFHTLFSEYVHYVWDARWTKRLAHVLSRDFCNACDQIIAPSTKIDSYLNGWGVKAPIEILPTGIDLAAIAETGPAAVDSLRRRLGIAKSERVAIFVGRLGKEKNVELLIRAMAQYEGPAARLLVVGDGPDRTRLESIVSALGVQSRVSFTGYLQRPEVTAAYLLSDAFVFASTTETQGLVVGEAMAAGLPVVAVEDDAVGDFVAVGTNGLLVPEDPRALAGALSGLLADEAKLAEFSEASAERARMMSMDVQSERLEDLYERTISSYEPRGLLPTSLSVRVDKLRSVDVPVIRRLRRRVE